MKCTICESPSDFFQSGQILGRHQVNYWRCSNCGSVRTEDPFWLAEAYERAITSSDVGLVARNLELARMTSVILRHCYQPAGHFLDYGGGYGLFVRLMRDRGYNFHWQDEFCLNLFAVGLEAEPDRSYDLITAFEVLEHLPQPLASLDALFRRAPNLLCTTELLPNPVPALADWDYYGPEHGQHIVFYTTAALEQVAQRWNKHFYSNGHNFHLFSQQPLNWYQQQILKNRRWTQLLDYSSRRPSLMLSDYQQALQSAHSSP